MTATALHLAVWSVPLMEVSPVRPGHACQKETSPGQELDQEWETAEFPERPNGWCVLLYSHPSSLNFPAAGLSCFPIREAREEKAPQVTGPFLACWLALSAVLPLGFCPDSFPRGGVTSCALGDNSLPRPVSEPQRSPVMAKQMPWPSFRPPPPLLFGFWRTKEPLSE